MQKTNRPKNTCPICRNNRITEYWAMPGYKLTRCSKCEMVWDPLPPEETSAFYDKTYFINENPKGGYANYFEGMRINRKTFSDRLEKIEKILGRKSALLDIGCALGDFLIEAKSRGWKDIQGIEISHYAAGFARGRGLEITEGDLEDKPYLPNTFDIVTYQDVIEHIPNPRDELKRAYKILKPGGIIFLVAPDVRSSWAKLLGPLWYHYKPHEHVLYFSKRSIEVALAKAKFKKIVVKNTLHVFSLEYILNRLRYYHPYFFEFLLKTIRKTKIKDLPFKLYTGEFEAWGQKLP